MSGWICSYRAIWEHPLFEGCAWRVGVWDWLLKKAAWKPRRFNVKGKSVVLKRGQLCVSQRQMEDETGVGRQALRTFLAELEAEGAINREPAHGLTQSRTIITICKYENYQSQASSSNPSTNQASTQSQPTKEQGKQINTIPVGEAGASDSAQTIEVSVTSSAVWNAGKPFLASRGVKDPGSMIGRWLKTHSPLEVLSAIEAAQKSGSQDPIPYITETLKGQPHEPRQSERQKFDIAHREYTRRIAAGEIQRGPDPSDPFAGG